MPTTDDFKAQSFMWRVWRVLGIGPGECLTEAQGGRPATVDAARQKSKIRHNRV
jgi:hypothetical protein